MTTIKETNHLKEFDELFRQNHERNTETRLRPKKIADEDIPTRGRHNFKELP